MEKQGYRCPYCGNTKRSLMQSNLNPGPGKISYGEETMLCEALVPKGKENTFDEVSDGTLICAMQWDPQDERDTNWEVK